MALAAQLELVKRQILAMDRRALAWHRANATSRKLEGILGVGPLISTALVASKLPSMPLAAPTRRQMPKCSARGSAGARATVIGRRHIRQVHIFARMCAS
jgi:transposase